METVRRLSPSDPWVDLGIKRRDTELEKIYRYSVFILFHVTYRILQGSVLALTILQAIPVVRFLKKNPIITLVTMFFLNKLNDRFAFHNQNLNYRTAESERNAMSHTNIYEMEYEKRHRNSRSLSAPLTFAQKINPLYFPPVTIRQSSLEVFLKKEAERFAEKRYLKVKKTYKKPNPPDPTLDYFNANDTLDDAKKMDYTLLAPFIPLFLKVYKNRYHPDLPIKTYMAHDIGDRKMTRAHTTPSQIVIPKISFQKYRHYPGKAPLFLIHILNNEEEKAQTFSIRYKDFLEILTESHKDNSSFAEFLTKVHAKVTETSSANKERCI